MRASSAALGLVLAAWLASAAAQDDGRRRPGQRAPRATPPPAAAPEQPPEKEPATKKEAPAPQVAAPARKRPGSQPGVEPAPAEPAPATESANAPEAPAETGRRRPGQPGFSRPTASGDRLEPGTPAGERRQYEVNRKAGLKRVPRPPVEALYRKTEIPDRWQLTKDLGLTDHSIFNPYDQNTLKADRPFAGDDWFFSFGLISDSIFEPRRLPIPVGPQGEAGPDRLDVRGAGETYLFNENLELALILYRGDTTFKPPEVEMRFTPVFNFNHAHAREDRVLRIDPAASTTRNDDHIGIQEAFVDVHLRNASDRYDFDSIRVGIQPFNADFRGFLFRDFQLGARLFGNRANNVYQYNVAYFRRIEKDTNSGLNDLGQKLRRDDVAVANFFWQDFPKTGFTSQAVLLYNRNTEGDEEEPYFNKNGFIERPFSFGLEKPRNYDVVYAGLNGDGHFGRLNFTGSGYFVGGREDRGVFVDHSTRVSAFFLAGEASIDFDWRRLRLSALYASGDDDPYDDRETGFDAVFENPLFAGADTSFWVRQNVPLIGGGGVAISGRDGVLNSFRSSKDEGQSNFTNPGTILVGLGADFDVLPTFRISANVNEILFATTEVVEAARNQGAIGRDVGVDVSLATIWRPLMSQNLILRVSGAALIPGSGFRDLYGNEVPYSVLVNLILAY